MLDERISTYRRFDISSVRFGATKPKRAARSRLDPPPQSLNRLPQSINDAATTSSMEYQFHYRALRAWNTGHLNVRYRIVSPHCRFSFCNPTTHHQLTNNFIPPHPIQPATSTPPTHPTQHTNPPTMSSFLAFSRRAATTSLRTSTTITSPLATRPFSIAASRQASGETKGKIHDSDHTTRKDDRLDVQTDNSVSARE